MAFPAPHTSTSATFATGGGTSLSGVLAGDFLLFVHSAHNFGSATGTITAVSDSVNGAWTQLYDSGDQDDGSNHHTRLSVWYFENSAAGNPSLTVSGTETGGTAYFAAITGAATASAIRASATDYDNDAVTATLSTAAVAGDAIFGAIGGYPDGGSTHGVSTGGWTSDYQQNINNSTSLGVAHKTTVASGGETSGVTFSNYPNTPYTTITFLLKPAGGATTVDLEAVISASGAVAAALSVAKPLSSAIAGDATVAATLSDSKHLSSVLAGDSSLAASLSVSKSLAAVIAVTASVVFAALTVGAPGAVVRRLRTMLGVGE